MVKRDCYFVWQRNRFQVLLNFDICSINLNQIPQVILSQFEVTHFQFVFHGKHAHVTTTLPQLKGNIVVFMIEKEVDGTTSAVFVASIPRK